MRKVGWRLMTPSWNRIRNAESGRSERNWSAVCRPKDGIPFAADAIEHKEMVAMNARITET